MAKEHQKFIDASKIAEEAKGTGKVHLSVLPLGIYATWMDVSTNNIQLW